MQTFKNLADLQIHSSVFTMRTIFKLPANYSSIIAIPVVITNSAPQIVMTQLHSPLSVGANLKTIESQATRYASCLNTVQHAHIS